MTRRQGFERLEKEILGEKAAALGRAGEKLAAALAVTTELGQALDRETDPARRAAVRAQYEQYPYSPPRSSPRWGSADRSIHHFH